MLVAAAASWVRSRRSRYVFLLLCSPVLLPLLCATFPILCAAELCISYLRRSRRKSPEEERLRWCEEGCCNVCGREEEEEGVGLLQRYLEDQLLLVGSMYECGDWERDDVNDGDSRFLDSDNPKSPLLS